MQENAFQFLVSCFFCKLHSREEDLHQIFEKVDINDEGIENLFTSIEVPSCCNNVFLESESFGGTTFSNVRGKCILRDVS